MLRRVLRVAALGRAWLRDSILPSYARSQVGVRPLLTGIDVAVEADHLPGEVAALYLRNRFDLLGSGWRDWSAQNAHNRVNLVNLPRARRLRRLISPDYQPLDWHLDVRVNHRWPAWRWSRWIRPGRPRGVDIKLPWELARMQHHVPLALAALREPKLRIERAQFFRDQVLDFIASNPPRFGVNWRTPMDVAIRAANWVIAYSIYRASGERFDAAFEGALASALTDHGRNVVDYMEWDPHWRANHYLANLCGLAIIASALPGSAETDAWLGFATRELQGEVLRQMQPDGSVFEASTGYHRLSVEMVVYATAVVLGQIAEHQGWQRLEGDGRTTVRFKKPLAPSPMERYPMPGRESVQTPFSPAYFSRLAAAAAFLRDVSKPDGRVPLIGDNDSGRFVRVRFSGELLPWDDGRRRYVNLRDVAAPPEAARCPVEDQRDHRSLLGAIAGVITTPQLAAIAAPWQLEAELLRGLAGGLAASVALPGPSPAADGPPSGPPPEHARMLWIPVTDNAVWHGLYACRYPDFGLYLFRSPRFFLAVRCGAIGQEGFGGHAHNDQLSVELQIDGRDCILDPGVYRYTVDPEERQRYRSVQAHFAPRLGSLEPGDLSLGPWRLGDEAQARVEHFSERCFQGSHRGFGPSVHRRVWIEAGGIGIADWCNDGTRVGDPADLFEQLNVDGALVPFCPAYGVQHA